MLEFICLAIVVLYVVLRVRMDPDPATRALGLLSVAAGAWFTEVTAVRLYGFYAYSSRWKVVLAGVPILISLIWPVVIQSAVDLARALRGGDPRAQLTRLEARLERTATAVLTALIVFTDAALIEPVAVHAGLWRWTVPGMFGVPLIGILGWGLFGGFVVAAGQLERDDNYAYGAASARWIATLALTHAGLILAWWGGLRWLPQHLPDAPSTVATWAISLAITIRIVLRRGRTVIDRRWILLRAPGAGFFFALLIVHPPPATLALYAASFTAPYLTLLALAQRGQRDAAAR